MRIACFTLFLAACGGSQVAPSTAAPTASSTAPTTATPAPSAPPTTAAATAPTSAASKPASMRALAVMKLDGDVSSEALGAAVDARSAALGACVPAIRSTDKVVGSLNLKVTVTGPGAAKLELQSPVNDAAEKCLFAALSGLSVRVGTGHAMVLLNIGE
jgi:hypothetical protein